MANFRGGFAFNNEAAKVEVEQAPDGTLVSCVNPVTGQSMTGGNRKEVITSNALSPFGDYDIEELASEITAGNISVVVDFDANPLGMSAIVTAPILADDSDLKASAVSLVLSGGDPTAVQMSFAACWPNGSTPYAFMTLLGVGTNITAQMHDIPATTTIYHHPMP